MTFQWPYVLIALPFVLGGLLALFYSTHQARGRLLSRFAATRLLPNLLNSYSPALRGVKNCFIASGVLLVVLALARPQWGYDWQENRARGVDVVFVLDTSRSMLTPDVPPSRLERAKLAIYDLVQKMPGNRVGLVAFAGDAFLQCPLTLDYDGFRQSLAAVDTSTIARGGTDIAAGLDAAATALEKSGNHKIIVLLTDGEDLEGQAIEEAKTLAQQGVTIYTVGVGTAQGEIIPIRDASGKTDFVRDARGELVRSRLDSTTLSDIATATHGFYEPLGPTGEGLMRVYEDGIKKIPEQNAKSSISRQPIERFQWPLAAGTLLLILELLIGTRRPTWGRKVVPMVNLSEPPPLPTAKPTPPSAVKPPAPTKPPPLPSIRKAPAPAVPPTLVRTLLLAFTLAGIAHARAADNNSAPNSAPATPAPDSAPPAATHSSLIRKVSPKSAQSLFEKGDYSGAADAYAQAADLAPQDGRFRYNQGESLYRNKDYDGAAQAFTKAISISDLALQQRAYYNLGNSHYRLGQEQMKDDPHKTLDTWDAAVKDYQNALDLDPADADARYNHDLVKQQIDDLKKKLEQQKQQQQKNQDQSQQNQQNQDQQNQQNQNNQQQNNQPQNSQNQQNQNNQQQNSQNQQNQNQQGQNQQNQSQQNQNQQNQNNSQQNNSSQNQSNQNNSSQNQSQNSSQNQPGQQNQSGNQNGNEQNKSDQQNGGKQSQPDQQNSANGQKSSQDQSKNQNGQNGGQKQPQNSAGQQPKPDQGAGQQPNKAGQTQPAKPEGSGQGKEPNGQKSGQQKGNASSGGGQSSGSTGDATANGTVVIGVMSHEEAMQLLDSLKSSEQKLPTSRLQVQVQNPSSSNQTTKDW